MSIILCWCCLLLVPCVAVLRKSSVSRDVLHIYWHIFLLCQKYKGAVCSLILSIFRALIKAQNVIKTNKCTLILLMYFYNYNCILVLKNSKIFVLFYVLFVLCHSVYYSVCKCVLYNCHRVATHLQLTNISYHIIYLIKEITLKMATRTAETYWRP